jgi:glycine oxidase ThiO
MTYPTEGHPALLRGGDVIIVGGGLVGLATGAALSARGAEVTIVADHNAGEASRAAAGMLAPSVERSDGPAHTFAVAARDLYPSYVEALAEVTGIVVPLNRDGILELVFDEHRADATRADVFALGGRWLSASELKSLEPAISPSAVGAFHFPDDGAVDNVALLRVLREMVEASSTVSIIHDRVMSIDLENERPWVVLESGRTMIGTKLVIAAGAWSPAIEGLPRPIPIEPVRGQMMSLGSAPIHHVTYAGDGYVVPRSSAHCVVGSTMEHVGFAPGTTPEGLRTLSETAERIAPALASARPLEKWSGLRPVTPDLLPIMGPDPDYPMLLYACGHSRNGILLGPLTGECVAALASGETPALDLSPFSVERFAGSRVTVK